MKNFYEMTLAEKMETIGYTTKEIKFLDKDAVEATKVWAGRSGQEYTTTLVIYPECGAYTAKATKPNGTTKWWYQK